MQNSILPKIKSIAWDFIPAASIHTVFRKKFNSIEENIENAGISKMEAISIPQLEDTFYGIVLADGTKLVSGAPSSNHIKMTAKVRKKLGIDKVFSKALIDYVVRYKFPHAFVPIMTIDGPESTRAGFHWQHRKLPQQSPDFDTATRAKIHQIFTLQPDWGILDIGCFLGHGAVRLAQSIGTKGRLIAVEAMPANATVAKYQLGVNNLTNAEVLNRAIWRKADESLFINATTNQANAIASDVIASTHKVKLETTSIEALTSKLGKSADLVSLTVNGAEIEAIEGLENIPVDLRPKRIIMPGWYEMNGQPRSSVLTPHLRNLGYELLITSHHFIMAWRV